MANLTSTTPDATFACPGCRCDLVDAPDGLECPDCARAFPSVAGLWDLRLESDRYLDLGAERAKAERLAGLEPGLDLEGLAAAYYAMTDDVVDARRDRFLRHIGQAEARGEALAARVPEAERVLELGCGTGGFLAAAARRGWSVEGADIAARWLVVARRRLTDLGLEATLVAASAERLPWPDEAFDVVVADSLLEHLDDPAAALGECARVLRPGGTLLVWGPNRYSLLTDPHVGLWGVGWLPRRWVSPYLRARRRAVWPPRTLSAAEARRLARSSGFRDAEVELPGVPDRWLQRFSGYQKLAARLYATACTVGATRALLQQFGPLWELRATKGEPE